MRWDEMKTPTANKYAIDMMGLIVVSNMDLLDVENIAKINEILYEAVRKIASDGHIVIHRDALIHITRAVMERKGSI